MTKEEYNGFCSYWADVCSIYNRPVTKDSMYLVFKLLMPYPSARVKAAIEQCMAVSHFCPTPADIIERINGGNPEERAFKALLQIKSSVKNYGVRASFETDDPALMYAVQACGGWQTLFWAFTSLDEYHKHQKEADFQKAYVIALKNNMQFGENLTRRMIGISESRGRGHKTCSITRASTLTPQREIDTKARAMLESNTDTNT